MTTLNALLRGIIDYAGLFPPAQLPMAEAVNNYSAYHRGPDAWMLGRFVVPASRLEELEGVAEDLLPRPGERPWELSVLGGADPAATASGLADLHRRHPEGELAATAVEMKGASADLLGEALQTLPQSVEIFFELPHDEDPAPLLRHLRGTRGRAKIRSGGVTEEAFPTPREMSRFLRACRAEEVPFKATAGLHHPLRGSYRLTYAPNSPRGTMFGFLNVFTAAAFLHRARLADEELQDLLTEEQPEAFSFTATELKWRNHSLTLDEVVEGRHRFARSFGSCSFVEPIEDLQTLELL